MFNETESEANGSSLPRNKSTCTKISCLTKQRVKLMVVRCREIGSPAARWLHIKFSETESETNGSKISCLTKQRVKQMVVRCREVGSPAARWLHIKFNETE